MADDRRETPKELYELPIESLGLSEKAVEGLKRIGIATVGACLDVWRTWNESTLGAVRSESVLAMLEAEPKLIEQGYLPPKDDSAEG